VSDSVLRNRKGFFPLKMQIAMKTDNAIIKVK